MTFAKPSLAQTEQSLGLDLLTMIYPIGYIFSISKKHVFPEGYSLYYIVRILVHTYVCMT